MFLLSNMTNLNATCEIVYSFMRRHHGSMFYACLFRAQLFVNVEDDIGYFKGKGKVIHSQ